MHIDYVSTNLICILKSFLGIVVQLFILVHPLVHFLEESVMDFGIRQLPLLKDRAGLFVKPISLVGFRETHILSKKMIILEMSL